MKKFLVFLVSIIVVICLGMTFYYFAKDEEVIKINTSTLYLNAGESISLDELGFSHTEKKPETKINFNAGGDAVKSIISYDSSLRRYVTSAKGGSTTIVITTNNRKFRRFEIKVVVGNGSEETPYHIYNEEDLFNVGTSKFDTTPDNNINEALTSHYILMNNITLTEAHDAIGKNEDGSYEAFQGNFNGNYYTIKNLNINSGIYGSLFAVIGNKAEVTNLNIENAKLDGNYDYAGALAGVINGYVDRISVKDSVINNSKVRSYTGGLAGKIETIVDAQDEFGYVATAYRVSVESNDNSSIVAGTTYLGGLAGSISQANIEAIKSATNIKAVTSSSSYCGGITGYLELGIEGFVRESYSISTIELSSAYLGLNGALFGSIDTLDGVDDTTCLLGLYYDKSACALDPYAETSIAFADLNSNSAKTTADLKSYNTFIFYYDKDNNTVLWKSNIWKITEGQFPVLKYTESAVHTNIDNNTGSYNPVEPPITDNDPITPPSIDNGNVSTDVVTIDSASKLLSINEFEAGKTYKVTQNIDLGGATWTAKRLNQATFTADSMATISNFSITSSTTYCGFFSSIVNSTVSNITFSNVTVNAVAGVEYLGVLAGVMNGGTVNNVAITSSTINSNISTTNLSLLPIYVGGMIGASTNSASTISSSTVNANITGNLYNAGGFIGWTGPNTTVSDCSFNGSVAGLNYVGGFVAQNKGAVQNSSVNATISSTNANHGYTYVGGFVGVNFNTINNCAVIINNIVVSNNVTVQTYYVGGFAGYNSSSKVIGNSSVAGASTASTIDISVNSGNTYVGGIVAQNSGTVTNCKNNIYSIGKDLTNVYTGGIVSQNYNGTIYACKTISNLYGDYVGGIVYSNLGNATISNSAVGSNTVRPTLKGVNVAGLVYHMGDGSIYDCLVITKTYGNTDNSISAGAVISFPVSASGTYGSIEHCIISNEFAGRGDKHLVSASAIFASSRSTGTLKNCVIDMTVNGATNASEPSYDKNLVGQVKNPASNSNYTKADSSKLYLIATYSDCGFSIFTDSSKTWYYTSAGSTLPTIVALEK